VSELWLVAVAAAAHWCPRLAVTLVWIS